jgi:hypothetical protein
MRETTVHPTFGNFLIWNFFFGGVNVLVAIGSQARSQRPFLWLCFLVSTVQKSTGAVV